MSFWEAWRSSLSGTRSSCVALAIAFGFEFINGFHDTANAVTTVIYTGTLKPTPAVALLRASAIFWACCWEGRRSP